MKCYWCHNPESIDKKPFDSIRKINIDGCPYKHYQTIGKLYTIDEVMNIIGREKIFMEESGGGVTFSGGEPTSQPYFLIELLKECRREKIHTAVDTNGYVSKEVMKKILPHVDLFLFDLKHCVSTKHKEGTGVSNALIIENLRLLLKMKKKLRIRIPMIPGFNFSEKEIKAMVNLLKSLPGTVEHVDLLPYHTFAGSKYKRFGIESKIKGISSLSNKDLYEAKQLFAKEGYLVSIGG